MATMDLSQYHKFLDNLVTQSATLGSRLLEVPANELIAEIDYRITQLGLDSGGNKIGGYDTKKMWAGRDDFDNQENFNPVKKKNGDLRKTVTLEKGYMELRGIQGYRIDTKVMERTGAGIKNIKNSYDESTGVMEVGFTDLKESVKFRGEEERGDRPILKPTPAEIKNVQLAQVREINLFLQEMIAQ